MRVAEVAQSALKSLRDRAREGVQVPDIEPKRAALGLGMLDQDASGGENGGAWGLFDRVT